MRLVIFSTHHLIRFGSKVSIDQFEVMEGENDFVKNPIDFFCSKYLLSRFEFKRMFYVESYTSLILVKK